MHAAKSAKDKRVAVAYFTQGYLGLSEGDILITDASHGAIASGQTSAHKLAKLFNDGVKIYSCIALHAKVLVLDGVVFVSSANLSESSESDGGLIEAGVLTESEPVRRAALAFIDQLKQKSTLVNQPFITEIEAIEVKRTWRPGLKGANKGITPIDDERQQFWILYTVPTEDPSDPAERRLIAKGEKTARALMENPKRRPDRVQWPSSSKIAKESKQNEVIIIIAGQDNRTGHASVEFHARLLHKESSDSGKLTYLYYEPSTDRHKKDLRWTEFKSLAKRAGFDASRTKTTLTKRQSEFLAENWGSVRMK